MAVIKRGIGVSPTEKNLAALADKIFLNLWTYPNLYKNDGQELCDVLVVCGDDVLIFSDKNIGWKKGDDFGLSWSRWYRGAIEESVKQINGASRYLRQHPMNCFSMLPARRNFRSTFPRPNGGGYITSRSRSVLLKPAPTTTRKHLDISRWLLT
jgi:hypothetical protein